MPADELFLRICGKLELERRWRWSGEHYAKTAEAWLRNTDRNQTDILDLFARGFVRKGGAAGFSPLAHFLPRLLRNLWFA